MKKTVKNTGQ